MVVETYAPVTCVELLDGDTLRLSDPADPACPGEIIRRGPAGEVLWAVRLPLADDWFVAMVDDGDTVIAQSWKGFRYRLAVEDGHILTVDFVK